MKYIVCSRPHTGENLISEELKSHGEKGFIPWDSSCMAPNIEAKYDEIKYFDNPDAMLQYVEANPKENFHLIYLFSTNENDRRMKLEKTILKDSSPEESEQYFKDENELFEILENDILNKEEKCLPNNISAVLPYSVDFTPTGITTIASNIIAQQIGFKNMQHIVERAIATNILNADKDGNILAPTPEDAGHRIHPDIVCDILLSNENQLGDLLSRLIYDENLFNKGEN